MESIYGAAATSGCPGQQIGSSESDFDSGDYLGEVAFLNGWGRVLKWPDATSQNRRFEDGVPVPGFDIHGIMPPFSGADPVAGGSAALSPYVATPTEIINALGTSAKRRNILAKWLDHRAQLRALGMTGFQWLDGSFVEKKTPNDLDVVSFLRRPGRAKSDVEMQALVGQNLQIFSHAALKATHQLDAYFVDMDGAAETIVEASRYFCGLFSHRRNDYLWKGMLKADLKADSMDDDLAVIELENAAAIAAASGATE